MSFQNRFKGKTSVMTKEGIIGIVNSSNNPIDKNSVEQFRVIPEEVIYKSPVPLAKQSERQPLRASEKNTPESLSVTPNLIEHERKKNSNHKALIMSDSKMGTYQHHQQLMHPQQQVPPGFQINAYQTPTMPEKGRDFQENFPRNPYDFNGQMVGYSQYMRNELRNNRGNIFTSQENPFRPVRVIPENNTAGTDFNIANMNFQKRNNGTPLSLRDVPGSFVKGSLRKNNDGYTNNNIQNNTYEPFNQNNNGPSSEVMITDNTDTKSVGSSSFLRNGNFKPYTINEYRELQKHSNFEYGGLGANIGAEDWRREKEKREKMIEFSKKIRMNSLQKSPIYNKGKEITNIYAGRNSSVDVVPRLNNQQLRTIPERSGLYNEMQEDDALNQLEQQYDYRGINFSRRQF